MCTMLTVSREFYNQHTKAVTARIMHDSIYNNDGFSLMLMSDFGEDTTLLRSMSVSLVLDVIQQAMENQTVERFWLHSRLATTGYVGINGCHGFAAGDWTVFHNGILSRPESYGFAVDSELIAFEIESGGIEAAIRALQAHETYANVFMVNNQTGEFKVIRNTVGTLFMDGDGNFSTVAMPGIRVPVVCNTRHDFLTPLIPADEADSDPVGLSAPYTWGDDPGQLTPELSFIMACIIDIGTLDEIATEQDWYREGLPWAVFVNMSVDELSWAKQLELYPSRKDTVA